MNRTSTYGVFAIAVAGLLVVANSCKVSEEASSQAMRATSSAVSTPKDVTAGAQSFTVAHALRIYVSAVNCEMNAEDAARVNALAETPGLAVEVVFAGISGTDSNVVKRAQLDLELHVPVRQIKPDEIQQYKSIGGATLPMALIVKGRQLKTIVSGESMPRTLSIVEASLTSSAPPNHHQLPEG